MPHVYRCYHAVRTQLYEKGGRQEQEEEEENINQIGLPLVKAEAGCENIHYRSWRRPTRQDCHRTCAHLMRV